MKRSIYYLEIIISYKKGKSYIKKESWAVSKYNSAQDIMRNDSKTMYRLNNEVYGNKYKSQKQLVITKVLSYKKVGKSIV
mgnify:CR=1 FL=1